jgi:3-dehydroquinate dehydratase
MFVFTWQILLSAAANRKTGHVSKAGRSATVMQRPAIPYHVVMPIYLDDQPVQLSGDDLASVLDSAADQLRESGRIVVEVKLDGELLVDEHLERRRHDAVGDAELRLYSADPRDLSRTTLEAVLGQLDTVAQRQREAADLISSDQQSEAMTALTQAIEGWQQSQQVVIQTASLTATDLSTLDVDGASALAVIEQVVAMLKTVRDTIEARDLVGLADTLAYEGPALIEQWQKLVTALIERIDEAK